MKKLLIALFILVGVIMLAILYVPDKKDNVLISQRVIYASPTYEVMKSSAGTNYKSSAFSDESVASPEFVGMNTNSPTITMQSTSSHTFATENVQNYSHENKLPESNTNTPLVLFEKSQSQSMSRATPNAPAISLSEASEDKVEALSVAQRCNDHSKDCGYWKWIPTYWEHSGCGWYKVKGHYEWVSEPCPPGVPVGDGTIILFLLVLVYCLFKIHT